MKDRATATETAANGEPWSEPDPTTRLTSLLRSWVPICARYEIVGGTGEGIGEIRPVKIAEKRLRA